jgi:hypothetical protein
MQFIIIIIGFLDHLFIIIIIIITKIMVKLSEESSFENLKTFQCTFLCAFLDSKNLQDCYFALLYNEMLS